jgi:anti-anti-sigma regulatory factor
LVGIGLALAAHLYREMSVSTESTLDGDTLTVSPQGVLWFASIPQIERLIRSELAAQPDLDRVVVDLGAVGRLDYSGAAALGRIIEELRRVGVRVDVTNVKPGSARAVRVHLRNPEDSPPD